MTKKREFLLENPHHIYNRGNQKERIFFEDKDYNTFIKYLKIYSIEFECDLIAYCLMPNHYHLVLSPRNIDSIPNTMQRLGTLYSRYLRCLRNWTGHVFQSRYKCKPIRTEKYFNQVIEYIRKNPVEASLVKHAEDFKWLEICTPEYTTPTSHQK